MDVFVYSDESGVFDKVHNKYFVYGGVIFLSKSDKDNASKLYLNAERTIRNSGGYGTNSEIKATRITNSEKSKLFRSLNSFYKFSVVIDQNKVMSQVFENKKHKQRYLDYAYKISIKKALQDLIKKGYIKPNKVENMHFFVDEHTTATDGRYELQESLLNEFKFGVFANDYMSFFPPIFSNLKTLDLKYCNSKSIILIRAADIIANKIFYLANAGKEISVKNMHTIYLPNTKFSQKP